MTTPIYATIAKNETYTYEFDSPDYVYETQVPPEYGSLNFDSQSAILEYIPIADYVGSDYFIMQRAPDYGGGALGPIEYFAFYITVSDPPTITQDLSSALTVYQLDRPVVSVEATGTAPLTYSWYVGAGLKQGPSSSSTFQINSAQYALGEYVLRVDVTNSAGTASSTCALTIWSRPLNIPLAVVDPSGGITSGVGGGVLTVAGPAGDSGQWDSSGAPTVSLVDPSDATLTVADMTAAYNTLMWTLGQSRALQTEPRMFFSTAGYDGLVATRPTSTIIIPNPNPPPPNVTIVPTPGAFVPYLPDADQTTLTISDVITQLNQMFSYLPDKIRFTYESGRVTFILSEGTVRFTNPSVLSFGSGERIFARIFNRADYGIAMEQVLSAPLIVQGLPFTGTGIEGVYPVPYGVYPGTISQQISATTINVFWAPSGSAGVIRYYVYVRKGIDDSFVSCNVVNNSPFACTGLEPNTQYKIQVIASTAFEISQDNEIAYATTKPF